LIGQSTYIIEGKGFSRSVLIIDCLSLFAVGNLVLLTVYWLKAAFPNVRKLCEVLIAGAGDAGALVERCKQPPINLVQSGLLMMTPQTKTGDPRYPVIGKLDELARLVDQKYVDEVTTASRALGKLFAR
jgi:hypothetical protein